MTAIEIRFAGITVRVVESVKEPAVAVIVVVPAASVVAKPLLLTFATEVDDEIHVTPAARSCEEPSV